MHPGSRKCLRSCIDLFLDERIGGAAQAALACATCAYFTFTVITVQVFGSVLCRSSPSCSASLCLPGVNCESNTSLPSPKCTQDGVPFTMVWPGGRQS